MITIAYQISWEIKFSMPGKNYENLISGGIELIGQVAVELDLSFFKNKLKSSFIHLV